MIDDKPVDLDTGSVPTNLKDVPNVPICRVCQTILEDAAKNYKYRRLNPDTRWFRCPDCEAHYGYHRMKGSWRVSPEDYSNNSKVRERFGLPVEVTDN